MAEAILAPGLSRFRRRVFVVAGSSELQAHCKQFLDGLKLCHRSNLEDMFMGWSMHLILLCPYVCRKGSSA